MKELKTTKSLVKTILKDDERARNSDSFLYFQVLNAVGKKKGIDVSQIPVTDFLLNMGIWGFP